MKVFLSSMITGFEAYREAAVEAITTLGHTVVRSEDFPASPISPQIACLGGTRQSDAVIVVLGARYGAVQPSGLSATHEEFREACDTKPTLVFVQAGITPEPEQEALIKEAREWAAGALAPSFDTPDALTKHIVRGLHYLDLARATGPLDQEAMLTRARDLLPAERYAMGPSSLAVVLVGGPRQPVLRPAQLEDPGLGRELTQEALFGRASLFDAADGTQPGMSGDRLVIRQPLSWLALDSEGTLVVVRPLHREKTRDFGLRPVIEEDVSADIEQVLRFADVVLDRIDPTQRLTHLMPIVALLGSAYGAWRTRAEHAASPMSMTMNIGSTERPIASLSPPARPRQAFRQQPSDIARDLTVLLRRVATR